MAIVVRAFKAVQDKDVQKLMFLHSSKTKVIFKRCPKISEKCEGLFWCLDHTGSRPRQADRRAQALKTRSVLSQFPSRHSARQTHILRNCKHTLTEANTHCSKLQTQVFNLPDVCHFSNTTAIWAQEILHLKVHRFATKVVSRQNCV